MTDQRPWIVVYLVALAIAVSAAWLSSALEVGDLPNVAVVTNTPTMSQAERAAQEADARVLAEVALGEDPSAAVAVMWTVLNRAALGYGRGTVLGVVAQRHAFATVKGGKVVPAWTIEKSWRRWRRRADRAELEALTLVGVAVLRGEIQDPTGGATHFHRVGTRAPAWAPSPRAWVKCGQHLFYQELRKRLRSSTVGTEQNRPR